MNKDKLRIYILAFMHLLVDGLCSYTIFSQLYDINNYNKCVLVFVLYNTLAFCTQPFMGLLLDKYGFKKNVLKKSLAISVILLIIGSVISFPYFIRVIFLGVANSLFHIVIAKYTVNYNKNKLYYLGLIVALGAIGLMIGTLWSDMFIGITFICLILILTFIVILMKEEIIINNNSITYIKFDKRKSNNSIILLSIIIVIVVLFRAIIGKMIPNPINDKWYLLLIGIATSFGKILGGVMSDKIGIKKTINITIPISAMLFILCNFVNVNIQCFLIILGIISFNTSMPITLFLLNQLFKNKEGFSFGILACTLFPGYLLGMLLINNNFSFVTVLIIGTILSILIINYVINKKRKVNVKIC